LEVVRSDSGLRLLAREVDLDERRDLEPGGGGFRVERVDELTEVVDDLRLAALQVADEVPAKRVSVSGVLGLEVLGAVFADHLDAGLREHAELFRRDVLRRGDDRDGVADLGANLAVALPHLLRRYSQSPPGDRSGLGR